MHRRIVVILTLSLAPLSLHAQQPKNVQILTGMSRPEVQRVMNNMRAGLGVHCHYCHAVGEDPAKDTLPQKARAREMMRMVVDLNARNFGGKPVVTCFTCHNGQVHPAQTPPLPQPIPPETVAPTPKPLPALSSVLQKYVAAVGRELTPSTPRIFKGTSKSASGSSVPLTITEAGEKLRIDVTLPDGSSATRTIDATHGWVRDPKGVRDLQPEELINATMARRPFNAFYTATLGDAARVVDSEKIGDHDTWVVSTPTARYWFDAGTGLLLRRVVYFDTSMGRIPEQTDFDDYRDVGGAKVPFLMRASLVDPWLGSTRQAESVAVGAGVEAKEFEKPE